MNRTKAVNVAILLSFIPVSIASGYLMNCGIIAALYMRGIESTVCTACGVIGMVAEIYVVWQFLWTKIMLRRIETK